MVGTLHNMALLGYRSNAAKSSVIVKNEHKELAENIFEGTNVTIRTDGAKHLGAVIGTSYYKETFMKNLVSQWVNELRELTKIAKSEPQAAYSNFTQSQTEVEFCNEDHSST